MIDNAAVIMAQGVSIASERKEGVDDNMTASHFHSFFELYYLEDGGRQHVIEGQLYAVKPHSFVVLPPHTMHHSFGRRGEYFKRIVVYCTPEILGPTLNAGLISLAGVQQLQSSEDIRVCESLLKRLLVEEDFDDELKLNNQQAALQLLVGTLLRVQALHPEPLNAGKMRRIVRYVQDNYAEDLSLDDICARFFISKSHLCREFKAYTGSTFVEYVNSIRILHAQRLFLESKQNISEIAKATGFSSLTHFERVFYKVVGQSPRRSRQDAKARQHANEE